MDPDANLAQQRMLAARIMRLTDADKIDHDAITHAAGRLAELVDALDTWIVRGGAMPARWAR